MQLVTVVMPVHRADCVGATLVLSIMSRDDVVSTLDGLLAAIFNILC